MSSVDNRIVNMGFNGQQFFSGVLQAIDMVTRLEQSLQMSNATAGMDRLTAAAGKMDLSGIGSNVGSIADRFSTLGVIGMSVINRLTTGVMNLGSNLVKTLAINPVMGGFNEFELKMKSVQTILANTQSRFGTTNADVTKALDELNDYADKTIYNFAQMTQNIGRFTTAGIDLDTSVSGIKGLANLGAFFNADATMVNRAMYQMSQAMAAGSVKLMDWNSMVNANMGGTEFVEDLERVARHHGIAIDEMIEKEGSFRETLRSGWLTNDIFLESLSHFAEVQDEATLRSQGYTDDEITKIQYLGRTATDAATKVRSMSQLMDTLNEEVGSSWERTWETIFGDFEESTTLFDGAYKMIKPVLGKINDARNDLLDGWNDLGGRDVLIDAITQLGQKGIAGLDLIGDAFTSVFDINPQGLYNATQGLFDFVSGIELSEDAINDARSTFEGFFSLFDIFGKIVGFGAGVFGELVGAVAPLGEGLLDITGALAKGPTGLNNWLEETNVLGHGLENFHNFLQPVREFMSGLSDDIGAGVDYLMAKSEDLAPVFEAVWDRVREAFSSGAEKMGDAAQPFIDQLKKLSEDIRSGIDGVLDNLRERFDSFISDLHNKAIDGTLFANVKQEMDETSGQVQETGESVVNVVNQTSESVSTVDQVATGLGSVLGGAVKTLSGIPWADIFAAIAAFGAGWSFNKLNTLMSRTDDAFKGLNGIFANLNGVLKNTKSLTWNAGLMLKYKGYADLITSFGLIIAAVAGLALVEGLHPGSIAKTIDVIRAIVIDFGALAVLMTQTYHPMNVGRLASLSGSIIGFATALVLIAGAVAALGSIDEGGLQRGLDAITTLSTVLASIAGILSLTGSFHKGGFTIQTGYGNNILKMAVLIATIAGSAAILSKAISKLAELSPSALTRGMDALLSMMWSLGLIVSGLAFVSSYMGNGLGSIAGMVSMIGIISAIVGGMAVLAFAMYQLADIDTGTLMSVTGVMTWILTAVTGATSLLALLGDAIGSINLGMIAMIAVVVLAVKGIADAVVELASIDNPEDLANTMGNVAAMLGGLAVVVWALDQVGESMSYQRIGKIVAMIAVFAVAMAAVVGVAEGMQEISDAMHGVDVGAIFTMIGIMALLGTSIWALGKIAKKLNPFAIMTLAGLVGTLVGAIMALQSVDAGGAAIAIITLSGALALFSVVASKMSGISLKMIALGVGFAAFAAGAALVGTAANQVVQAIKAIAELSAKTAGPALSNLPELLKNVATGLVDAFITIIETLAQRLPEIGPIVVEFVVGIIQAIWDSAGMLGEMLVNMLIDVFNAVGNYAPALVDALVNALINVFRSVAGRMADIFGAIKELVDAINTAFLDAFGEIQIEPGSVDTLLKAMWEIFALISLMRITKTSLKDAGKCALELGMVFGTMAGLFAIIGSVADADSVAAVDQLNDTMATIALVCGIFTMIPWQASLGAIKSFSVFVGGLTGVLAALGGIKQIPGADWLIEQGGDFLQSIGEGLGKLIGGIGAGITGAFTSNFGEIGTNLAAFATNAAPFLDVIKNYDETTVSNLTAFTDMINAIGDLGSDGLKGIEKVKEVSSYLPSLGTSLQDFGGKLATVDPNVMGSVSGLITALAGLAGNLGPLVIDSHGTEAKMQSLTDFSGQLSGFATDLKGAIEQFPPAEQLDTSGIEEVITVANDIITMMNSLPPINEGSGAWFTGTNMSINAFATGISAWADAMQDAITRFPSDKDTDTSGIQELVGITQSLKEVQVDLAEATKIQGWGAQQFLGLGEFGNQIRILCENLKDVDVSFKNFGEEGEFSPARVRNLVQMMSGLADVQSKLSEVKFQGGDANKVINIGGLARTIAEHITDFSTLATNIGNFQVTDDQTAKFQNFSKCLGELATIQTKLQDFSDDDDTISGKTIAIGTFVHNLLGATGTDSTLLSDMEQLATGVANINPDSVNTLNTICTNLSTLITTVNGIEPVNESKMTQLATNIESLCRIFNTDDTTSGFGLLGGYDFTTISTNIQTLSGVIPQLIGAFDSLNGVGGDGTGVGANITGFLEGLKGLFEIDFATGVTNLTAGIQSLSDQITAELSEITGIFNEKAAEFETAGKQLGSAFVNGINNFGGGGTPDISSLVNSCLNAISSKVGEFRTKGEDAGQKFVDGVNSKQDAASDAGTALAQAAEDAAGSADLYQAGVDAGQGYVNGILSKVDDARAAGAALAAAAGGGNAKEQQSNSPSKKFRKLGRYAGEGYALGIEDRFDLVNMEAGEMAAQALATANALANEVDNGDPIIKPIYDGSNVEKGIAENDAMLRALQNRALATSFGLAHGVSDTIARSEAKEPERETEPVEANPTYNFTQNNYSPKAISRLDVFRDTKGLLSKAKKEAVK